MSSILVASILIQACIVLASLIFIGLLLVTKMLPKNDARNGVLLFTNFSFIAFFYLLINLELFQVAIPLLWLFVPSTITLGYWFYRFNSSWLNSYFKIDKWIAVIPIAVLSFAVFFEVANYVKGDSVAWINTFRVHFTVFVMRYLFAIFNVVIIGLSLVKFVRAEKQNKDRFSNDQMINLNWSKLSLVIYAIFFLGMVVSELANDWLSELTFNFSILLFVLYLGYFQMKRIAAYIRTATIVAESVNLQANEMINTDDDLRSNELFQQIEQCVDQQHLFLKDDFTLSELAETVGGNTKYVSKAINSQSKQNFSSYINAKRINFAVNLLNNPDYQNYSLEGIATESGFRSKSSFNAAFKKQLGKTPTDYLKDK